MLFGNTGGVMEAAVRTVYEVAMGQEMPSLNMDAVRGLKGVKEATLTLPGLNKSIKVIDLIKRC